MENLDVTTPHQNKTSPAWQDRRVFVTGGTGLIGSWLIRELLSQGAYVAVLVMDADPQSELLRSGEINRVSVVNGSLEDFSTIERAINLHETDTVFHLGAQTQVTVAYRFPLSTFESNLRGSYNLLEACRIHKSLVKTIVVASSDKAYGEQPRLPYTEDMPLKARNPYDVSKSCTDLLAQSYFHTYDLPVGITRFGNVYGGGDLNWGRIVPGTIRSYLERRNPIVRSDGTFTRDYIYVKDVAQAYLRLAECLENPSLHGEAFNFSTESPISVLDLVEQIHGLMNVEDLEPEILNSATAEIRDQYLSATKAKDLLDWSPKYDLESGLSETVAWYKEYFGPEDS